MLQAVAGQEFSVDLSAYFTNANENPNTNANTNVNTNVEQTNEQVQVQRSVVSSPSRSCRFAVLHVLQLRTSIRSGLIMLYIDYCSTLVSFIDPQWFHYVIDC